MKKLILLCLLAVPAAAGLCQSTKIDSLEIVLNGKLSDTTRVNTLNELAESLRYSGPEKMYDYARQAKTLATAISYGRGLTKAVYNLATYFETYRNEDSVQHYFSLSLQLSDSLDDQQTYTLTRNAQGLYLVSKRRFEEALQIFYEVLRRHEEAKNTYGQMAALNNIGLVAMETRQYEKAIRSFKKALPFQQEPHPVILNNIGSCYGSLSKYDSARWYVTLAIQRAREINHLYAEANGLHILGTVYMSAGEYKSALDNFLTAEKIREKVPSKAMQVADYTNISSLYAQLKQPAKGINYGLRALEIAETEKLDYKIENIYEALALNYLAAGDHTKASDYFRKWGIQKDSSYAKAESEALAEMKARYEIEKKEQEIQIKDLRLAEQELKLNQRNLQLYSSIGGAGVLLILLYLAYNRLQLQKRVQQLELAQKMQAERERISSDLHDHVGAQLTSILAGLQITDQIEAFQSVQVSTLINSLKEDARETLTSLRDSIWSLHHDEITLVEFVDHVERHLQDSLKYLPGIQYRLQFGRLSPASLSARVALNITRIVQESIQNVIKHANATEITVNLATEADQLNISISDNGIGMDPAKVSGEHYGIGNMERRVKDCAGSLVISSKPGEGTTVSIRIPLSVGTA